MARNLALSGRGKVYQHFEFKDEATLLSWLDAHITCRTACRRQLS